jgi:hypothetical protein
MAENNSVDNIEPSEKGVKNRPSKPIQNVGNESRNKET